MQQNYEKMTTINFRAIFCSSEELNSSKKPLKLKIIAKILFLQQLETFQMVPGKTIIVTNSNDTSSLSLETRSRWA